MGSRSKRIPVIFENDFFMVFDKPSGLPVQGGKGVKTSLDTILSEKYSPRPFLVHRLDRDTSGLILVAKTKEAAAAFSGLFSEKSKASSGKRLVKKYLAVSAGKPDPPKGLIRLSLEIKGRRLASETSYCVISDFSTGGIPCSVLELEPGTGRMHQIRRHLSAIGHPVLGDDKYGDFTLNKQLKKTIKLKRLMLHSWKLLIPSFPPYAHSSMELEAPPPERLLFFCNVVSGNMDV
ncbi:MAG: RluA family pseudouridine synthase [Treponema sp.]|jgi:23S rRNA pseudouridine955/2504/2580 synthase|nr:RluA family pseudouridine synthase [Treponema sp.]